MIRHRSYHKGWWYKYVPGGGADGLWGWCEALKFNWFRFRKWAPLLTLTSLWFWRDVWEDSRKGFKSCGCGRTWFRYRLLPALVGDKRFGGGC
jgi:hypothetical protein